MVFGLLAVLVGAAYVGTAKASYGDYAAAKMPQYGSEEYRETPRDLAHIEDEYHEQDRSPEAPASADYKYEEDLNVRTASTNNDDDWPKTSKRTPGHRRLGGNIHPKGLILNNDDKIKPKIKQTLRRHSKWRNSDGSVEINRIPLNGGRIRSNDIIDKEDDINEEKYEHQISNDKNFRSTSDKIIRRKPRDRADASTEAESEDPDDDDEDEVKNEGDSDKDKEGEYSASDESDNPKVHYETIHEKKEDYAGVKRPLMKVDDDIIARLEAKKVDQKSQDEYQDYYDMKRVNNIKKKITVLYRRTKARAAGSTTSHRVQVWTYRRSYVLDRYNIPTDYGEEPIPTTSRRRTKQKNRTKTQMKVRITTSRFTLPSTTELTLKILTELLPLRTQAEPQWTTTGTVPNASSSTENTTNATMSMAEKSRLSILKKTLLKEGLSNKTTIKPPVLMHVSQAVKNTLVMVEPPNSNQQMQLMGKLGSFIDTPERIARAKSIMRRKLIAGARSIQDLTDKWDEMICDYIDVVQLDHCNKNMPSVLLIFCSFIYYIMF